MEEREVISLVISCLVMAFVLLGWRRLNRIPNFGVLFSCFALLFASFSFSVFENVFFESLLNFFQHLTSGLSGVFLAMWCWLIYMNQKKETPGQ